MGKWFSILADGFNRFKVRKTRRARMGMSVPPWIITGAAAILLVIVVVMAFNNYNRQRKYMVDTFLEKGSALIKAFEAGTRTGMRSIGWGGPQLQNLMEEMAKQPDVLYIQISDPDGRILAHSDPERIGIEVMPEFDPENPPLEQSANWRHIQMDDGVEAFEVYKTFKPFSTRSAGIHNGSRRGRMHRDSWWAPDGREEENVIFIGFDRTPFAEARKKDLWNTVIISSVLLLSGMAGLLTMFVAQNYRSTKRKLQDTSAMADEVVAGLPVGLVVTDEGGKIVLENAVAASITGVPEQEAKGRPADEVLPESLGLLAGVKQKESRVVENEVTCDFGGGRDVALSVSAAPIINEDGVFIGRLVIFRDLTEIKSLQQAVQRKEKLAAIGGLAAGVAHEIRNPLSSIKGMATYFKERLADDPEAKEAALVMIEETERLNRVISELLEFARTPVINTEPADIDAVIDHSIRLIRADADDGGVHLKVTRGKELPLAEIDVDRFVQCLLNLYLNSIQAMGSGGELSIASRRTENGGIEIRVEDTGPGIPPGNLNRIFDPYFTTKSKGTGLGLAIVHKIVESHGGNISVKEKEGGGTVFIISLPPAARQPLQGVGY